MLIYHPTWHKKFKNWPYFFYWKWILNFEAFDCVESTCKGKGDIMIEQYVHWLQINTFKNPCYCWLLQKINSKIRQEICSTILINCCVKIIFFSTHFKFHPFIFFLILFLPAWYHDWKQSWKGRIFTIYGWQLLENHLSFQAHFRIFWVLEFFFSGMIAFLDQYNLKKYIMFQVYNTVCQVKRL